MSIKSGALMIGLIVMAGLLFIWLGIFNVSATDKHWEITTALLHWTRERSIEVRAKDITVPPLDDLEMISKGAKNYDAMCAQCHLAPGVKPTELYRGLYPQPPVFHNAKHAIHDPATTYWTIKHGLKMTGMPAWGAFHTDQQLWQMVAFVNKLDGMDAAEYQELVGEGGHSHAGEEHDHVDEKRTSNAAEPMPVEDTGSTNLSPAGHYDDGHTH